jgi:hypothetical protein
MCERPGRPLLPETKHHSPFLRRWPRSRGSRHRSSWDIRDGSASSARSWRRRERSGLPPPPPFGRPPGGFMAVSDGLLVVVLGAHRLEPAVLEATERDRADMVEVARPPAADGTSGSPSGGGPHHAPGRGGVEGRPLRVTALVRPSPSYCDGAGSPPARLTGRPSRLSGEPSDPGRRNGDTPRSRTAACRRAEPSAGTSHIGHNPADRSSRGRVGHPMERFELPSSISADRALPGHSQPPSTKKKSCRAG